MTSEVRAHSHRWAVYGAFGLAGLAVAFWAAQDLRWSLGNRYPWTETAPVQIMLKGRPLEPNQDGAYPVDAGQVVTVVRAFCLEPVERAILTRALTRMDTGEVLALPKLDLLGPGVQAPRCRTSKNLLPIFESLPVFDAISPARWRYTAIFEADINPRLSTRYVVTAIDLAVSPGELWRLFHSHVEDDRAFKAAITASVERDRAQVRQMKVLQDRIEYLQRQLFGYIQGHPR